jgi:NAD(P) transhydrogenase subunit alpha
MKIDQIIVVKETREGEGRVALTPKTVKPFLEKGFQVFVENEAGVLAGFQNEDYIKAGARIFTLDSEGFPPNSLLLRVKRPSKSRELLENKLFAKNTAMIGFLDPFDVNHENHLHHWKNLGIKLIFLELLDLTADDPKNAQAAMSRFAGALALQDALQRYKGSLAKRVTILGTGPAGLSAAFAARDLGLSTQLFGRQERHRQAVESAGIIYHILPSTEQSSFIRQYLSHETIVIGAARAIGKKTPILIDEASLSTLPESAVLIDLSTGEGGCIIGSKEDEIISSERGISIINVSGYPKAKPQAASEAYAHCMINLVAELLTLEREIDLKHPLLLNSSL